MLDHQLQEHLRRLRREPEDLGLWLELVYRLRRLRVEPRSLPLGSLLPGLVRARTRAQAQRVDRLLSDLYGIRLETGSRVPGDHWGEPGRRIEVQGVPCQGETGMPLGVQRVRDRGRAGLVPEGEVEGARVDAFYLDLHPVGFAQVVRMGRYSPASAPLARPDPRLVTGATMVKFPASCLTWQEAHDFAAWAGGYLPTVLEWKRALRLALFDHPVESPYGMAGMDMSPGCWAAEREQGMCRALGARGVDPYPELVAPPWASRRDGPPEWFVGAPQAPLPHRRRQLAEECWLDGRDRYRNLGVRLVMRFSGIR